METPPEQVLLSPERARWCRLPPGQESIDDDNAGADRRPTAPAAPAAPPRPSWGRSAVLLTAALALAIAGVVGYTMGHRDDAVVQRPTDFTFPSDSSSRSIDSTSRRIAAKLDDSIVNITTRLSSGGAAAGTGVVISSDGLVLTNNHVIADTAQLRVENSANGSMHSAKVLGYSVTADVALIKIEGVSGLTAAPIGDASNLAIDDAVVGLGNAGGNGGEPSIAPGRVTALDQRIVASDTDGSSETLEGLIQIDAGIQPGDSGGPLADASGRVVGIDVAASRDDPRFSFSGGSSGEAYAIPIQKALTVARRITSGAGGDGIHIGADARRARHRRRGLPAVGGLGRAGPARRARHPGGRRRHLGRRPDHEHRREGRLVGVGSHPGDGAVLGG